MRWFWSVVTDYWGDRALPPRKLNLTELERMGAEMAQQLGGTWRLEGGLAHQPREYALEDLANLLPDERAAVRIHALSPEVDGAPGPWVTIELSGQPQLGGTLPQPLWDKVQPAIRSRWKELGKPTLRGWRVFPAVLLGSLTLALGGAVVLWVLEPMFLLLVPLVLFALVAGYYAGVPRVNSRIARYYVGRPLPIDFRVREKVREERTASRAKWKDRGWGFLTGVLLAVVGLLLKIWLS